MRTGHSDGCNPLGGFAGSMDWEGWAEAQRRMPQAIVEPGPYRRRGAPRPNWTGRPEVDPVMYAPRAIAGSVSRTQAWEQRVRAAGRPVDATGLTAVFPRLPPTPCEWFGPDVTGNVYECGRGFGPYGVQGEYAGRCGFVGWCPCTGRPHGLS